MKIYPFHAIRPQLDKVPHSNAFFDTVKFRYDEYVKEDLFEPTNAEAIYIYQIKTANNKKFLGLIACVDINEYINNNIKKHEKTIITNEELQTKLLQTRGAAIKPVLLTYPALNALDILMQDYIDLHRKYFVIELGDEKHRFWQITEGLILKKIKEIFEHLPKAYIADGHHRSASFAAIHAQNPTDKTNKMLCAFFPDNQLKINAFHRVVKDLNGLSENAFLEQIRNVCHVKTLENPAFPTAKFELTMQFHDKWYQLTWKSDVLKHFAEGLIQLDVHLLNEKILKTILGIKNIRTDERVTYIEGTKSIDKEVLPSDKVAFYLFPIAFADMKRIADDDGTMPPKSTFFAPRMKNGLIIYEI